MRGWYRQIYLKFDDLIHCKPTYGEILGVVPNPDIVCVVMSNVLLNKYQPLPGTTETPDEICRKGLIRFGGPG
jgi:hypothetical protein